MLLLLYIYFPTFDGETFDYVCKSPSGECYALVSAAQSVLFFRTVFVFTRTVLQKLQHLWLAWHVVFLDMCFPFGMRTSFLELSVAVDLKRRPRVLEQLSCSFLPSLLSLEALQAALLSERAALFLHRSKIGGFLSRTLV